jgi:hypothetical protein
MKLPTPSAPFSPVYVHGESITIETEGKVLVLPTGNADVLPLFNEYTINSNRLSIAESPFGGLKGSGSPDYAPGTVNIIEGDGVYLQDVNGQNSSKTLSAGKLKELNLLNVDTTNHSITEEFVVANTAESNNPTLINDCTSLTGISPYDGTSTLTINSGINVSGTAGEGGSLTIQVPISISADFLILVIRATAACNLKCVLLNSDASGQITWTGYDGKRFAIPANTDTTFILPINAPTGSSGHNPTSRVGSLIASEITKAYIGVTMLPPGGAGEFTLKYVGADVAKQAYIELQTPDNLADSSLTLQTWDGSAYQTTGVYKLDSTYSAVSTTSANWILSDGTKFDDVYGSGLGRALFPKGISAETKAGSTGSITYSANKGTSKRIGFRVDLPPSDGGRTNFNKCRMKAILSYTDTVGNIVPDLSGNNNTGTIVGGVVKLNEGGLKFDGSTGRVDIKEVTHSLPLTYAVKVKFHDVATNKHCIVIGTDLDFFSLYIRNGAIIARTYADGAVKLCSTPLPALETWNTIIAEFTQTGVKIYKNSATSSNGITYTSNTANLTGTLKIGQNVFEYSNIDLKEAAVIHGLLSDAEKTEIYNSGTLNLVKSKPETFAYWKPVPQNMGSTTYQFSDTTSASTGLQNLAKPWVALYDPTSNLIDFYLFTHRPKNLEFRRDESGNIYELVLYPGNGLIYHGQITYPDLTLDSDSNLIPNFLEESIEGSLTKFLKPYGMVI